MVTEQLRTAIECGTYEIKGQFAFGSNYTFLVAVNHEGSEYPAVYKPLRGEQPHDVQLPLGEGEIVRARSIGQAIVDAARQRKADLIVLGSKGMQGARRMLGSIPNKVSHHAPCDLLIVQTT